MAVLVGSAAVSITPDFSSFLSIAESKTKAALSSLDARLPVKFDIDAPSLAKARAALGVLAGGESVPLRFTVDKGSVAAARAALGPLAAGQSVPIRFTLDPASVAKARAQMGALAGAETIPLKFEADGASLAAATTQARGLGGALGALSKVHIPLFGGALGKGGGGLGLPSWLAAAGGVHLLAEGIIETTAVLLPAAIAFAGFGAAAIPTVQAIYQHMSALNTVVSATGRAVYPLTGEFGTLSAAVRPQVYQLFGDALTILTQRGGAFTGMVTGAGTVLDQLAGRFTAAVTSGSGFSGFMKHADADLAGLGTLVGNLGGVLGNVFRALPGYAGYLLQLADAGSHVLEWASAVSVPLLKVGLAAHGAVFYLGLGASGLAYVIPRVLSGLSGLALKGAVAADSASLLGTAGEKASTGLLGLAGGAETAAALPWGWISVGVAALGALTYALFTAKDAASAWTDSLEASLLAAPALRGVALAQADQAAVTSRLTAAQKTYAGVQGRINKLTAIGGEALRGASAIYTQAHQPVTEYQNALKVLSGQSVAYTANLKMLGHQFGGTAAAQGLVTAAGITYGQMVSKNKNVLAGVIAQIAGTAAAYRAMGQTGGILGEDMAVLSRQASTQFTAMQKLDQSWESYLGLTTSFGSSVTGSLTAFRQLSKDAKATGATFTGTSKASLALQNTFYTGLAPSLEQVVRGMTDAHAPTRALAKVIATELNPAVKDGALRNDTMRTAIFNMATEAGYSGPDKIRPLTRFIDDNKTSLQNAMTAADRYGAALARLPQEKKTQIIVNGAGKWAVTGSSAYLQGASGHAQRGGTFAAGGLVTAGTTPTADDVFARVSKGELIVPASLVAAGAVAHLHGKIPGYAAGGVVGSYAGGVPGLGPWVVKLDNATVKAIEQATARATYAGMKAAAAAASAARGYTGSTGGGAVAALAQRMAAARGWTGAQWLALNSTEMAEAGWRLDAQNPVSRAYGIAQFINGPAEYAQYGGNAATAAGQVTAFLNYVGQRYRTPEAAWAHEQAYHWYDGGGVLPPGLTLAANMTGSSEFVLRADQLRQLAGGGPQTVQYNNYTTRANPSDIRAAFAAMEMRAATRERIGRNQ
jgi:hypothetical protein